jgi:cell division protein FtsZ
MITLQNRFQPTQLTSSHGILVIGVGGGGSNAVEHMFKTGIQGVDFLVCNTDLQAIKNCQVPNRIQLGKILCQGLGAGGDPLVGEKAAREDQSLFEDIFKNPLNILFVTAGMGGGTGTGAASVIANYAKEAGVLVVGVVTLPFRFEGRKKDILAQEGLYKLREACDTTLVIYNEQLKFHYGKSTLSQAFNQANILQYSAVKGIAEIITVPSYINVDFEDVNSVLRQSGIALMGIGKGIGKERALNSIKSAAHSPLLYPNQLKGASRILLSIRSGKKSELQMDELTLMTDYIRQECHRDVEFIFGHGVDEEFGHEILVTLIATAYSQSENDLESDDNLNSEIGSKDFKPKRPVKNDGNNQNITDHQSLLKSPMIMRYQKRITEPSLPQHIKLQNEALLRLGQKPIVSINDKPLDHHYWQQFQVPAYLRRNVKLYDMGESSKYQVIYNLEKFKDK